MARRSSSFLKLTAPIRREIRKAAKKLKGLEKKVPPVKRRGIKLDLKLLKDCYDKLGNIMPF